MQQEEKSTRENVESKKGTRIIKSINTINSHGTDRQTKEVKTHRNTDRHLKKR